MFTDMTTPYIMEDSREADRLSQKVDPNYWVDRYYEPCLAGKKRILDVGCGPGVLAAEIAHRHADKIVLGVDISDTRLRYASNHFSYPNLSFKRANSNALPFQDNYFDLVYSRLMLEYLENPQLAVREMMRVCSPGGQVILQDLDGQLVWHYPEPDFQQDLLSVVEALKKTGHDVFVGRKLYHFAKSAGLKNISVNVEPYHLYAGGIPDKELKEWDLKLDIALPTIEKIHGKEKALQLKDKFLKYLLNEESLTYSVLFTVIGEVI